MVIVPRMTTTRNSALFATTAAVALSRSPALATLEGRSRKVGRRVPQPPAQNLDGEADLSAYFVNAKYLRHGAE